MAYEHNPKIKIKGVSFWVKNRSAGSTEYTPGLVKVGMQGGTVQITVRDLTNDEDDVPVGRAQFNLKKEEAVELIAAIKKFYDL